MVLLNPDKTLFHKPQTHWIGLRENLHRKPWVFTIVNIGGFPVPIFPTKTRGQDRTTDGSPFSQRETSRRGAKILLGKIRTPVASLSDFWNFPMEISWWGNSDFMDILWISWISWIYYGDITVISLYLSIMFVGGISWIYYGFTLQRTFGDGKLMKLAHLQMIYV